jgi:hypothetical protein
LGRSIALAVAALVLTLGVATGAYGSRSTAHIDPHAFTARVDNPWFPLKPGTTYLYTGVKDGKPSREILKVTHQTRMIEGVPCVVVEDRLWIEGRLGERTTDWYTQDRHGNVWYFGEQTAEFDRKSHVASTEGTWLAGKDGAMPGIYMPAHPRLGQSGHQEYYKGHAEDRFRVIALLGTVTSGSANSIVTEETTPLEPGVVDNKIYVRGIGTVTELTVKGGDERNQLISVSRGA